jgi:CHAT domain-containing protein
MLRSIGYAYYVNLKDYDQGRTYYQQGLAVEKERGSRQFTAGSLFHLANMDKAQKLYQPALEKYQQSLVITRARRDFSREIEILQAMSEIYAETNARQQAESLLDRLIAIAKKSRDPRLLIDRANEKILNAEPKNALKLLRSAISIAREIGDKDKECGALFVLGNFHFLRSEYQQSLEVLKQSLTIVKQLKNRFLEAGNMFLIGSNYGILGEKKQAIEYLNTALSLFREGKNRSFEGQTLAMLSMSYTSDQQPRKGLELAQQSVKIAQETKEALFQTSSILALALAHNGLNDLRQAYELAQQAFALAQEYKSPLIQMQAIAMQAEIFSTLGDNRKALEYQMQALAIVQQMQSTDLEADSLSDIANIYRSLNEPAKAMEYAEKALALAETSQDPKKKISARRRLARIHASQKRYDRAITLTNEAQAIADKLEATESNRLIKFRSLVLLAYIDRKLGKLETAKAYLEEDLAIPQPTDQEPDPDWGIGTKLELARVYRDLKQPNKSAPLYQEVIANTESKRQNIRTLSADLQKSFVQDTIDLDNNPREALYREYASVLLTLDRIAEAQQVLDLLKVQELAKFVQTSRSVVNGFAPSATASPVQGYRQRYDQLLATAVSDGKELEELRKTPQDQRSNDKKQRLEELAKREKELNIYFNQFVDSPEVTATVEKLNRASNVRNINLDSIKQVSNTLKKIPNSVMLYPFILEDRIELILTTADAPPLYRTVKISRSDLSKKILRFLNDVGDPRSVINRRSEEVKESSKELYDIIIRPIESDLNQAGAKTIIYAPDGLLRYVPISALYDGKQWLVERYATNIITANNLTNFEPKISRNFRVLAGAFPPQNVSFTVDGKAYPFQGLKSATIEVNQIAKNFPNTTKLIGASFKRSDTEKQMSENNFGIVHLATHGKFIPDAPQNSFLIFGDGESIKLKDVRNWSLKNVDLVVLSACETAIGSIKENSEGVEVVGLGFYLTESGAKAAIATLWKIDDAGTEALMGRFYAKLSQADLPSVEVLRQAQIDMIRTQNSDRDYSHPFYWAPFILIGNGF